MKPIFVVLIAAAFVANGSGLLMAQSSSTGATKRNPNSETEIIITSPNKPKLPMSKLKADCEKNHMKWDDTAKKCSK